jgi:hypothetical protein
MSKPTTRFDGSKVQAYGTLQNFSLDNREPPPIPQHHSLIAVLCSEETNHGIDISKIPEYWETLAKWGKERGKSVTLYFLHTDFLEACAAGFVRV